MKNPFFFSLFFCFLVLPAACSAPRSIRQASRLQLESLAQGKEGVSAYQELSDRVIERAIDLQESSQLQQTAFEAVQQVLREAENPDPLTASDQVASRIFEHRRLQRRQSSPLKQLRIQHLENLDHLVSLLELLRFSQELIHECLTTEVGPAENQLEELRLEIGRLRSSIGGGR